MSIFKEFPSSISEKDTTRFWSHVDIRGDDECWEWKTSKFRGGYGQFKVNGRNIRASRLAYFIQHGVDPLDAQVCHTCDNPPCCNPSHLFLGDNADNRNDSIAKGRDNTASGERHGSHTKPERWARGERVGGSILTAAQVSEMRALYLTGAHTQQDLADRFGVKRETIGRVVRGENWKHLPSETAAVAAISWLNRILRGEKNPSAKLTAAQVETIRAQHAKGLSYNQIADSFHVSKRTIANIITGRTWH